MSANNPGSKAKFSPSYTETVYSPSAAVHHAPMADALLRLRDVVAILKVSRATVYVWIKQGRFPKPLKMGRATVWRSSQIEQFLASLG
jgi:prophage regulatory protein